jgi:hypothetical protein
MRVNNFHRVTFCTYLSKRVPNRIYAIECQTGLVNLTPLDAPVNGSFKSTISKTKSFLKGDELNLVKLKDQ